MLEAVFAFALLLSAMEFTVVAMIAPRYRLRLLGSRLGSHVLHCTVFILNLAVHWGTVTGTMAATGSFVTSIFTLWIARIVFGEIRGNVRVRRGIVGYRNEELVL